MTLDETVRAFLAAREASEAAELELDTRRAELAAALEAAGLEQLTQDGYSFRRTQGSTYLRTSKQLVVDALEAEHLDDELKDRILCAALVETEKRGTLIARKLKTPEPE